MLVLQPDMTLVKVQSMSKEELGTLMYTLQKRVDSGQHTGADVQVLRRATQIWMERYEIGI